MSPPLYKVGFGGDGLDGVRLKIESDMVYSTFESRKPHYGYGKQKLKEA